MAAGLPPGFIDLQAASDRQNEDINIMGVVVDFLPATRSRGPDFMSTFTLADATLGGYDDGLKVRIFRPVESDLPSIQGAGDVMILRNVKVKPWSGMKIVLSNCSTGWTVFPANTIPETVGKGRLQLVHKRSSGMQPPTVTESLYAISLCNSQDRTSFSAPIELKPDVGTGLPVVVSSALASPKQKVALVKDVKIDCFYDLVGQVVKTYTLNGRCELYFTDYTSNNLLFNYEWGRAGEEGVPRDGDEHGYIPRQSKNRQWPGPFGKMTLQVALWEPHSHFVSQNVKDNDYIFLRNTRIKLDRDGKVEGCLHSDRRYPERIDVTILKHHEDERVKEVMRRKRDYWNKFKVQSADLVEMARGQKRKQDEESEKPLKGRAKKRKKQQQQQQQQKASHNSESAKTLQLDRYELNKHIRCNRPAILPSSIHNILDNSSHKTTTPTGVQYRLPFQNICCRANVRVVDYFPKNLADFAVPCKISEYDVLSDSGSSDSDSENEVDEHRKHWDEGHGWGGEMRWEWRFYLLLQDSAAAKSTSTDRPKSRLQVLVAEEDAVMLLKMDPENLRKNPTALATLREKLFILWGDLEERKAAAEDASVSALKPRDPNKECKKEAAPLDGVKIVPAMDAQPGLKPFVCCLKEYGVRSKSKGSGKIGVGGRDGAQGAVDAAGWERRFRMFGTVIM